MSMSRGADVLESCSRSGEYEDWPLLRAAIISRLAEIVAVFQGFETRRLALVDGGATLSEAAVRTTRVGLDTCSERVAEIHSLLNGFDKRFD